MHPIGGGLYSVHDFGVIENEEGADNDDEETDSIIDCKASTGYGHGGQIRGRTKVFLGQQLVPLKDGTIVDHRLLFEGYDLAGSWTWRPGGYTGIAGDGIVWCRT